jgi:hypothetical protein
MDYKRITQAQLEIWLNDPTTRAYLQSLYWSKQQYEEIQGNGSLMNKRSAELTYGNMMENEGLKSGYTNSMNAIEELERHDLLEVAADGEEPVEMPDIENIYNE